MRISDFKKRKLAFLLLFILFHVVLIPWNAEASEREESLVIGLLPEMNVFRQKQRFEPLAAYLGQHMGISVRLTMLSLYGNIIERMEKEEVDAAFLGSFTGALAISQLHVVPLARPINTDGTSTYYGQIFVRKESGIQSVLDMQGKSMALVEKATTAGYIFPLAWLKHQGVDNIDTYFSRLSFTGSHDSAVDAVLNGKADIGAAKNTVYEHMQQSNPRIAAELVVLATSPRVPSNSLCVRDTLDEKQKEQLKTLLLNLHLDPEGLEVLKQLGARRFVETNKEDYQPVIDMTLEAGIDLHKYDYHNP